MTGKPLYPVDGVGVPAVGEDASAPSAVGGDLRVPIMGPDPDDGVVKGGAATVDQLKAYIASDVTVDPADYVPPASTGTAGEINAIRAAMISAGLMSPPDAPTASGALSDLTLTVDEAMTPVDVSGDFTGYEITFALAPSSDALVSGLELSSAGVLSGTPTAEAAGSSIVVRATNAGGTADSAFTLTVEAANEFDLYASSVNGDDSNDGTSPETPFATLSALKTAATTFGDGVTIALEAGSEWREDSDLPDLDEVTFSSFGDVATYGLPIIRGDVVLDAAWDDSTERGDAHSNVYSRDLTPSYWGGTTILYVLHWEDGVRLTWVDDLATCQSTPGTWYSPTATGGGISGTDGTSYTLYIHPFGSTNPTSDGKTYEATDKGYGLRLGDDAVISNIHGMRVGANDGAISAGLRVTMSNCLSEESLRHNYLFGSGVLNYCVGYAQQDDDRTGLANFVGYYNTGLPEGSTIVMNNCIAVLENQISSTFASGFHFHTSDDSVFESVTLNDCALNDAKVTTAQVETLNVNRLRMERAEISPGADNLTCNIVDPYLTVGSTGMNNATSSAFSLAESGSTMTIDGMRAYIDGDLAGSINAIIRRLNTTTGDLTVTNSVVKLTSSIAALAEHKIIQDDGSGNIILDGNVWDVEDAGIRGRFFREATVSPYATITGSNNVYHDAAQLFRLGTGDISATDQLANETSSVTVDPQFADPANGDWSMGATGLPSGAGLERSVTYLTIPATVSAAESWVVENVA